MNNYVTLKCIDGKVCIPTTLLDGLAKTDIIRADRRSIGDYHWITDFKVSHMIQIPEAFLVK